MYFECVRYNVIKIYFFPLSNGLKFDVRSWLWNGGLADAVIVQFFLLLYFGWLEFDEEKEILITYTERLYLWLGSECGSEQCLLFSEEIEDVAQIFSCYHELELCDSSSK